MSLATLIKRLQDIMRKDSGVDGDAQRLAQIVWLIFLKIFDYKEETAELEDNYEPVIPKGYRWRDWAVGASPKEQLTGNDLLDFVNNTLIPVLSGEEIKDKDEKMVIPFDSTDERSMLVKSIMTNSVNYMKNGYLLRDVINLFNEVDFSDSNETHEFNDMYEGLLKGLQSAGTMGEFYTGRAITRFGIEKVNPQIGGTLADWACGTGGFLVDALQYMRAQIGNDPSKQKMLQHAVRGGEFKPMPYRLCVTNLLLHDIELPNITYGDSLDQKTFSNYNEDDLVEYAALNPPYGGVALDSDLKAFPADLRSSETADLFVALTVKRLKKNGRAVIVLPDGFLFGTDNAKVSIKKYLMKECNLHTIIRLPPSCFAPYTPIATNLLFFDKTGPTDAVWFYRLDMPEGYKHFSKTKPMQREHFAPVDAWWDDRKEIKDTETDTFKSKKYTIDEIIVRGYDIDLCGYPTAVKEILSPEDTMRNFIEHRTALNEKLDHQLAEIQKLLGGVL
ncbi:MAG: type I restriction-modification system subunit M [Spirochaetales bacterium]|nr:type I restriction-modification system subunit M [Spirochaetales bacterium]